MTHVLVGALFFLTALAGALVGKAHLSGAPSAAKIHAILQIVFPCLFLGVLVTSFSFYPWYSIVAVLPLQLAAVSLLRRLLLTREEHRKNDEKIKASMASALRRGPGQGPAVNEKELPPFLRGLLRLLSK